MRDKWNFSFYFCQERNSICDMLSIGDYIFIRCRWPVGSWVCGTSSLSNSGLAVMDLGAKVR